jgi:fimbrial isopeptide formation D2 family protein/LPXTG-motif cell wall-anchored protein
VDLSLHEVVSGKETIVTSTTRHGRRSALAVGAALSLAALSALAGATAANAASIDTTQQGQLIIHKFENPGNGDQNPSGTGTQPTTKPIAGVVFEYCTIDGIDLTAGTNAGWDEVNAITAAQKQASAAQGVTTLGSHTLSGCTSLPATDATGTAASAQLPLGAYFVREVSAPSNVVAPAAPFVVTLPTPADPKNLTGDWVYNVNVYPKNTVADGPVKNVVNQPNNGVVLGAPVEYQVTQLIPELGAGETYNKFILTDTLDAKLTPLTTAPVTVKSGSTTFVSGTDYTSSWSGQTLTVTFTPAGLAKLVGGQNVVFDFQATVNTPGTIDNQAFVNLNDYKLTPGVDNGPDGSPTSTTTTRWGELTAKKVNSANANDGLVGAQFNVYMGTTESGCTPDITGLTKVTDTTGAPYVATSDSSGIVNISGLWVGDTELTVAADGTVSNVTVAGHDFQARCYVLEEIKAPAGYVLPASPETLSAVLVAPGAHPTAQITIKNTPQEAPELPFTGSNAQIALTIGGIALIVIALGGILVIRRRRNSHESA